MNHSYYLKNLPTGDAQVFLPSTVSPNWSIQQVAPGLRAAGLRRLEVVEERVLLGARRHG